MSSTTYPCEITSPCVPNRAWSEDPYRFSIQTESGGAGSLGTQIASSPQPFRPVNAVVEPATPRAAIL